MISACNTGLFIEVVNYTRNVYLHRYDLTTVNLVFIENEIVVFVTAYNCMWKSFFTGLSSVTCLINCLLLQND